YAINANIAIVTGFMCYPDQERARMMGEDGLRFFSYALGHHYVFGRHEPGKTNIWQNYQRNPINIPGAGGDNACIGTPDFIRRRLREYEEVGVDQVVFISQAGNNQHEDICSSLNLFAERVLPDFKAREERDAREKAERMAPVLEKAMKRKPEPRLPNQTEPTVIRAGMLP